MAQASSLWLPIYPLSRIYGIIASQRSYLVIYNENMEGSESQANEGELVVQEILRRFRDYKMPEVEGALWFDPEWNEPLVHACTTAGLAIGGMCWFPGAPGASEQNGSVRIWAQTKASSWPKYLLYCNAQARNLLRALAQQSGISFVIFVFINQPAWGYARRHSRELLQGKTDDLPATYQEGEVRFQTPLPLDIWGYANIPCERGQYLRVPASPRGRFWSVVVTIVVILIMIFRAVQLFYNWTQGDMP